jgi:hypothetical protein
MKSEELKAQIKTELDNINKVLDDLRPLTEVLNHPDCSNSDKAAAATFLSQCYMGIENILKRLLIFCGASVPSGHDWHISLIQLFRENRPVNSNVPILFDNNLYQEINGLRRLRHVVMHSYGFTLDRDILREAAPRTDKVMAAFSKRLRHYLATLNWNIS